MVLKNNRQSTGVGKAATGVAPAMPSFANAMASTASNRYTTGLYFLVSFLTAIQQLACECRVKKLTWCGDNRRLFAEVVFNSIKCSRPCSSHIKTSGKPSPALFSTRVNCSFLSVDRLFVRNCFQNFASRLNYIPFDNLRVVTQLFF
jgi:hypothetical protein